MRIGGNDRTVIPGAAAMHVVIRFGPGGRTGFGRGVGSRLAREFSQLADRDSRLQIFQDTIEYLPLDFDQLGVYGIDDFDKHRLHALRAVTDPGSLGLVDDQVAALQNAHARASQRPPRILPGNPVEMYGHLRAVAHQGVLVRGPDLPIFHPGPRRFDLGLKCKFDDLHRLRQRVNFFLALDVADLGKNRRGVNQLGVRKGFADLLPRSVENRSFRGPRSFDIAETRNPNSATLDVELFESFDNDPSIVPPGLAHIARPVLHRGPARGR